MKKTILSAGLVITLAICVSFTTINSTKSGSFAKETRKEMKRYSLPGEDNLNVTGDTIHPPTGYADFALKNADLFINYNGTNIAIDSMSNKIDTLYLRTIYNSALTKVNGSNYVTALQIKYGINSHKIKLYFKPICLTRDSSKTIGSTLYGYYSNHNNFDNCYYTYSPQGFSKANYVSQFQPDSLSYLDSIHIRHHAGGTIGSFNNTGNDSGDVSSVIYSFQELYSLVKNNPNSRYIKVSNIGINVNVLVNGVNKTFIKHDIMFGPCDLPPMKTAPVSGSGTFYNQYADLAGMCPPSCGELSYPLQ
jgi:hypothetical protein